MSIGWTDDLATGIERIDAQHRALYDQIAALAVELSRWLSDWLRDHIRRIDGEMARALRPASLGFTERPR